MPQQKPEFVTVKEFKTLASKLVQKYPEILDGIDPNLITCVAVTNKDPKEGQKPWEIRSVPYPIRLDNPYDHYVIVNQKEWDSYSDKHKALLCFAVLSSIDKEDPSKIVPFDLKDRAIIVRTVGTDYMERSDIPDILNENIKWKTDI